MLIKTTADRLPSCEPFFNGTSLGWYEASIKKGSRRSAYWPWFLLATTNKLRIVIPDRELGRVKFLILSRRLAGGKNITEESLCFSSYVGSYGRWLGLQFWEVVPLPFLIFLHQLPNPPTAHNPNYRVSQFTLSRGSQWTLTSGQPMYPNVGAKKR